MYVCLKNSNSQSANREDVTTQRNNIGQLQNEVMQVGKLTATLTEKPLLKNSIQSEEEKQQVELRQRCCRLGLYEKRALLNSIASKNPKISILVNGLENILLFDAIDICPLDISQELKVRDNLCHWCQCLQCEPVEKIKEQICCRNSRFKVYNNKKNYACLLEDQVGYTYTVN